MTDESGTRAFTMVFTGDTAAWAVDRDGNDLYPVSALIARATEFPTPESMPAALPPSSAFTCCAELSADGLTGIRFDRPVVTWVDSFLGFETGMRVPAGYYDRNKGTWTASEDGFVVRLLDTDNNGITDALDRDGDGQPDDLDGDGSFSDEVKGLDDPGKYAPGSTFWRVEVTHFTPWDYNLSAGPPEGAVAPNFKSKGVVDMQISGDSATSLIEPCAENRGRILHKDIPVAGTGMSFHYASNRAEGYTYRITVPASGDTVPENLLKRIVVNCSVAGKAATVLLPAAADQTAEFTWDGKDCLGNLIDSAVFHIGVGFVYDSVYRSTVQDIFLRHSQ